MKNAYEIVKRPLITEKSTKLVDEGKYTFEVMKGVNKVGDAVGLSAVLRFPPLRVADRLGDRG